MTVAPVLTASLRRVAVAVQIEWSPVVIARTEGGLLYAAGVCGAGGGLYSQIPKVQDGFGHFNLLLFFLSVWGG